MKETQSNIVIHRGDDVRQNEPKVSIVIPAYNVAEFVGETLKSVFSQSFADFEVVLVNDGSPDTDRLEAALEPYIDRIIYLKQVNSGASVARNTGIDHARGEFIAFLDGDDIWHTDYLQSQLAAIESRSLDMVYCDAELFGQPSGLGRTFMEKAPSNGEVDVDALLDLRCNVITSGTLARREIIIKAGMFEAERVQGEDFHLWVRIAHVGGKIGYQRAQLLRYRVSVDGFSGDSTNRVTRAIDVFKRLDADLDLTEKQRGIIRSRIYGFEADLAVVKGKAYLLAGDFDLARREFRKANQRRSSLKLVIVSIAALLAPGILMRLYRKSKPTDVAFSAAR